MQYKILIVEDDADINNLLAIEPDEVSARVQASLRRSQAFSF